MEWKPPKAEVIVENDGNEKTHYLCLNGVKFAIIINPEKAQHIVDNINKAFLEAKIKFVKK